LNDVRYLLELIQREKLKVKDLVSHVVIPKDFKQAYDGLLNKKEEFMAVVIDWGN
jgi:threonine dehydrogenase-like Zn-dependent dehydrogenase